MSRLLSRWFLWLLPLLLAGCAASFDREWDRALVTTRQAPPQDITGAWRGTWRSDANGHNGALRCVVSHEDSRSDNYRFHYHATFARVLSGAFVVTEQVERKGPVYLLRGEHDLGSMAGGLFHYEGTSTAQQMKSIYRSKDDHGVFELSRP